ncbi:MULTISPECIES: LysR family transcriptional regulator [unclassified Burkholderia]|uniref:LysR family transcriptional regulator n=1 Tax=unclassified Burkholderia TaxID=2613784 RepID=UPI002AB068D3|nr:MULTISPECIES: LysR family transcriptional regulator [unclassified Burkholderia]
MSPVYLLANDGNFPRLRGAARLVERAYDPDGILFVEIETVFLQHPSVENAQQPENEFICTPTMQKHTHTAVKWDDLRYFLAVANSGSYLAAGKALGVDRTTVSRRVDVLEKSVGSQLFVLDDGGFQLTAAGRAVLSIASRMEEEASLLATLRQRPHGGVEGTVRLAVSASLGDAFIGDIVAFHHRNPFVNLDVSNVGDPLAVVAERSADLGICVSHEAPARLDSVALGEVEVAVYGPADRHDGEMTGTWIGWGGDIPKPFADWLREYAPHDARVSTKVNSWDALKRAVLSGGGVAPLWCMLAEREPGLARVFPDAQKHYLTLWLVSHESAKRNAAQQAVWLFLTEQLRRALRADDERTQRE